MNDFFEPPADAAYPAREEILRRFEAWLDSTLDAETPPEGIAAELLTEILDGENPDDEADDAFAVQAALTALTQEVKLQGRAFHGLSERLDAQTNAAEDIAAAADALRPASESIARLEEEIVRQQQQRERALRAEAERNGARPCLETLADLHERIERGAAALRKAGSEKNGLLARFSGAARAREALRAHEAGTRLLLERVEAALAGHGVRRLRCVGQPFNAATMAAVAVEDRPGVEEGTVLEELRGGYEWNGELFRTAEVKVARPTA